MKTEGNTTATGGGERRALRNVDGRDQDESSLRRLYNGDLRDDLPLCFGKGFRGSAVFWKRNEGKRSLRWRMEEDLQLSKRKLEDLVHIYVGITYNRKD
jgi:hypothetical protein